MERYAPLEQAAIDKAAMAIAARAAGKAGGKRGPRTRTTIRVSVDSNGKDTQTTGTESTMASAKAQGGGNSKLKLVGKHAKRD